MLSFLDNTFVHYKNLLEQRIATRQHLTEDSVRYSFFFAALNTTNIQQHEIVLELPHPKFEGKEIDTYVQSTGVRPELYIEFKFHRASKSTSPKPQKAGSLFKDFSRLSAIKSDTSRCLVVYLTDMEMAKYFDKHKTVYSDFWHTPIGENFVFNDVFISKTTDTFRAVIGDFHHSKISVLFSTELFDGYQLKVFEVN